MTISGSDQLTHTTVRLECYGGLGEVSHGTGFYFKFVIDGQDVPLIVTNKHVIKGRTKGKFFISMADSSGHQLVRTMKEIHVNNFEGGWILHPDPNVDLAVYPLATLVNAADEKGERYFFRAFEEKDVPTDQVINDLTAIEEIIMIGYPNAIWDSINNMPIVRRGITATNPRLDYNGTKEFLIDCACFPGSSGSPVCIFNQGAHPTPKGIALGTRMLFLGVLYAGPQHFAVGEIKVINSPLAQTPVALSKIPNNLGFVIKSSRVLDFKPIIISMMAAV